MRVLRASGAVIVVEYKVVFHQVVKIHGKSEVREETVIIVKKRKADRLLYQEPVCLAFKRVLGFKPD